MTKPPGRKGGFVIHLKLFHWCLTIPPFHVRGYGESDKPHEIEAYTMKNMAADVIGIVKSLGYNKAITIGHDWGGPIALNTAALYPEIVTATGTLSVPYMSRGPKPTLDLWKEIYKDRFFYQLYFQKEGVAEKEFENDLERALRLTYTNSDGRGMAKSIEKSSSGLNPHKGIDSTFLEGMEDFKELPEWLTQEDIDYFVSQFQISGLRGPLNRYRAQNIDWEELSSLPDQIEQPAFFITGTLAEITPIIKIDDTPFPVGAITKTINRLYQKETGQI